MDLTLFIIFVILIISIYYFIGVMNDLKKEIRDLNTCSNKSSAETIDNKKEGNMTETIKSGLEFLKNFI
jgi:hypothetical protein